MQSLQDFDNQNISEDLQKEKLADNILEREFRKEFQKKQSEIADKNKKERLIDRKLQAYSSAQQQLFAQHQKKIEEYRRNNVFENPDPNITVPIEPTHEDIVKLSNVIHGFFYS